MKKLTYAEEQIMQILWDMEKAFVKDIIEQMPEPKPAYNTVSTIIRILEKKGVVGYHAFGKTHQYYPLISKEDYARSHYKLFMKDYFGNSFKQMVSFFAQEEKLSAGELEDLINEMKTEENS
ncbi:MAG: BlaI/MecI/CopY family transcriptional regulator [Bacteroidales bacterium]|nr:BlaI/MecI/CopY family transcriptional regulator [Bacteroidales bacterium]MCF8456482.1 BlaI/MecI/CopY family transcriptional regulator [Bacteroidales bacterium]